MWNWIIWLLWSFFDKRLKELFWKNKCNFSALRCTILALLLVKLTDILKKGAYWLPNGVRFSDSVFKQLFFSPRKGVVAFPCLPLNPLLKSAMSWTCSKFSADNLFLTALCHLIMLIICKTAPLALSFMLFLTNVDESFIIGLLKQCPWRAQKSVPINYFLFGKVIHKCFHRDYFNCIIWN